MNPKPIRRLTEIVINQINAGEVVERPANVVKELVENSLDAGATQIEVSLKDGGMKEILVTDDGCGILPEELGLAIERHATSKISEQKDLAAIASFGFRGEALASIASVSRMRLRSSTDANSGGAEISVDFGVPGRPFPAARRRGTSIWVYDLFEKVPARKNFLRSVQTELAYTQRTLKELALAHPEVSFQIYHQGELLQSYQTSDVSERFWSCLKPIWEPLEVTEETQDLRLLAFLSPPSHLDERSDLFLFINRRPVRNRMLLAAVRNAYIEGLGKGHEPSGAIYLSLALDKVDVNAHPQKLEVRCLNQERLYPWIYNTIAKKLSTVSHVREAALPEEKALGRCVGKLKDRYLVFLHSDRLEVTDTRAKTLDGRSPKYQVNLSDIEKHFNP